MKTPKFETEAALCAAFLEWAAKHHADVKVYAECAGCRAICRSTASSPRRITRSCRVR